MPRPEEVFSVSQLAEEVRLHLEKEFYSVWVGGEVTNFKRNASGHMYFSLKDAKSQISCTFFRGSNLRLRFDLKEGLQVLARGLFTYYPPSGDAQLNIFEVQPKGIGAAELALRQLKEKLLTRGYFDPKRKRPLPVYPKRLGLVASATGAAIRDMLELLAQRWPLTEVVVVHSRVQGEGSGRELAAAVRMLGHVHMRCSCRLDALVLGRGGGSSEDLAAFNEEVLADAIFQSPVPVVSAVGHETDVSIADLVADHRAETPSAAVVRLTPNCLELAEELRGVKNRMSEAMLRRVSQARQRVDQAAGRPVFRRPLERIQTMEQRLNDLASRLDRAAKTRRDRAKEKVDALGARLETLSPLHVLQRGYSLTHLAAGRKLVRDAGDVSIGDEIVTRLANGEIVSEVKRKTV